MTDIYRSGESFEVHWQSSDHAETGVCAAGYPKTDIRWARAEMVSLPAEFFSSAPRVDDHEG